MGIRRSSMFLLLDLYSSSIERGSVLQIGRQGATFTKKELMGLLSSKGLELPRFELGKSQILSVGLYEKFPTDLEVFSSVGFSGIHVLDVNNYEGADILHDLNLPVSQDLYEKFDLIYDGGSTEHVFNLPQVLENYSKMVKVGGVIIHDSPTNNWVNHGYYQIQPELYLDYYNENNYEVLQIQIVESKRRHLAKAKIYDYDPEVFEKLSHGGWGKAILDTWISVRKTESITCKFPQQSRYENYFWTANTFEVDSSKLKSKVIGIIEKWPRLRIHVAKTRKYFWSLKRQVMIHKRPKYRFKV